MVGPTLARRRETLEILAGYTTKMFSLFSPPQIARDNRGGSTVDPPLWASWDNSVYRAATNQYVFSSALSFSSAEVLSCICVRRPSVRPSAVRPSVNQGTNLNGWKDCFQNFTVGSLGQKYETFFFGGGYDLWPLFYRSKFNFPIIPNVNFKWLQLESFKSCSQMDCTNM